MAEADALREWALALPPNRPAAASPDQLARTLEFMAAALPSRGNDVETGRMRFSVYASILGRTSNEALAYMARRACETLEWFPSVKQCLDILATYKAPASEREQALLLCDNVVRQSFADWREAVRGDAPLGNIPERWLRIGVEEGYVRRLRDGSYVSRALYHGPAPEPYEPPPRGPIPPIAPVEAPAIPDLAEPGASAGLLA